MKFKFTNKLGDAEQVHEFEGTSSEIVELYSKLSNFDATVQVDVEDRIKRALDEAIIKSRRYGGTLR